MRYILLIVSLLFLPIVVEMKAQSWQQVYDEMMTIDDDEESGELLYDNYELMEQLAAHPLDLNSVTREELDRWSQEWEELVRSCEIRAKKRALALCSAF